MACGADDLDEVDMACDDDPCPRETRISVLRQVNKQFFEFSEKLCLLFQEITNLQKQLEEKQAELRCVSHPFLKLYSSPVGGWNVFGYTA